MIDSIYEDKWYQTPKSAGAGHYNMPKGCATLLCCACVDETICVAARYPTLRICGYMARNARPCGRKNPLLFPFSERSPLSDFRQIRNKGNGIHKGGNLGVHPCAHRRGCGDVPAACRQQFQPDLQNEKNFESHLTKTHKWFILQI